MKKITVFICALTVLACVYVGLYFLIAFSGSYVAYMGLFALFAATFPAGILIDKTEQGGKFADRVTKFLREDEE